VKQRDVSALMTVRNGARYVDLALTSMLEQTVPPSQIVVVDDGSTDDTPGILDSFGRSITVVRQPPSGISAGINRALRHAKHEVVAFLDADDLWEPNAIELRLKRLAEADSPDVVGGATLQFVSPEIDHQIASRYRFDPAPMYGPVFGSLMFRRCVFELHGPLDESLPVAGPVDWIARGRGGGLRIAWIAPVVLRRRIHTTNISIVENRDKTKAMLDIVRRHHRRMLQRGPSAPAAISVPEETLRKARDA
jgi:glycosyltransferase involved in cell wall biosynthesis